MADFVTDTFTDTAGTALTAHTPDLGGPISVYPSGGTSTVLINPSGHAGSTNTNEQINTYAAIPPSINYDVAATITQAAATTGQVVYLHARVDYSLRNYVEARWTPSADNVTVQEFVNGVGGLSRGLNFGTPIPYPFEMRLRVVGQIAQVLINGSVEAQVGLYNVAVPGLVGLAVKGIAGPPYPQTISAFHAMTPPTYPIFATTTALNFAVYTPSDGTSLASLTLWYPSKNIVVKGAIADEMARYLVTILPGQLST